MLDVSGGILGHVDDGLEDSLNRVGDLCVVCSLAHLVRNKAVADLVVGSTATIAVS